MNIYFVGQKGLPAISGGVEKHVEELASGLVKAGHNVYVYTRHNYSNKENNEYRGIKLINLPSLSTKHFDAISHTFLVCLDLIFKRKNIDIVHFHSIGPSSLILLVKIFKRKTPIAFTFHSKCYLHKKWGLFARTYLRFSEWLAVHSADEIIAISKDLRDYIKLKYDLNSTYIPNGAEIKLEMPAKEILKWGINKDEYVLSTSRLVGVKGLHYLIKAFNSIKTDKKLVLAGDGSFTNDYVKQLKDSAKDNKNIIFVGRQSGRALEELYSNACLFVLPSESEGLSLSLLEAMSYGVGVLVSDISANVKAIENNGFIFANKNSQDLANKLQLLLNNIKMAKEAGKNGKAHVLKNFNWSNITLETLQFYNKLYNKKNQKKMSLLQNNAANQAK